MLVSAAIVATVGLLCWRHRSLPGALPAAVMMLLGLPWILGAVLEILAVELPAKILWYKFASVWPLAIQTARFCFAVDYAGLGRWLTRRSLALLILPWLIYLGLILTNDARHWMWLDFSLNGTVRALPAAGFWILMVYGYLLFSAILVILIRLFVRSPAHRPPLVLILVAMLITHTAFVLDAAEVSPIAPWELSIVCAGVSSLLYAVALFRYHMFDPMPTARQTAIEQMREGMVVLDAGQRIADLNPAAARILGVSVAHARGRFAAEVLPADLSLAGLLQDSAGAQSEITLGRSEARHYALHVSPLHDWQGATLGTLLLLHDVTEQRQTQAQLLEQQRALATLSERERLARELHDSIGQVLGYAAFEVEAARKLIGDGQTTAANTQLARLAGIVRDAHADVREYILNLRASPSTQQPFLAALGHYLDGFTQNYGIQTELAIVGLDDEAFEPDAQMQLFRIIQEALSNARRHGDTRRVQVTFEAHGPMACITVQDDGRGFDPTQPVGEAGSRFGLQFMRERAEQLGGRLAVHSAPGQGTRVVVEMPVALSR